jgi:general secretion pathway protein A
MYKEHFGLKETPFSIAPDPRYLYMSDGHQEALAHLLYGIKGDGGFILLTGEVGTGKTTVCRCLLQDMPDTADIAFILNSKLSAEELLATICDELGIRYPKGAAGEKVFIDRINKHLLDSHARGRSTILIIEEAQNLSSDVLEHVRLLTNLETNERKLLQIIMIGQPELQEKLARPELRQLAQRITARYHLVPLTRAEVSAYVSHRLAVAGARGTLFPTPAIDTLFRLSGGIPRLINILCDRALLGAYVQGQDRIDGPTLGKAAREVFGSRDLDIRRKKRLRLAFAGLLVMVCGALTSVLLYGNMWRSAPDTAETGSYRQHVDTMWWFKENPLLWQSHNFTEGSALAAKKKKIVGGRAQVKRLKVKRFDVALPLNNALLPAGNEVIQNKAEQSGATEAMQSKQVNTVGKPLPAAESPNRAKPEGQ